MELSVEVGYPIKCPAQQFVGRIGNFHVFCKWLKDVVDKQVMEGKEGCETGQKQG